MRLPEQYPSPDEVAAQKMVLRAAKLVLLAAAIAAAGVALLYWRLSR